VASVTRQRSQEALSRAREELKNSERNLRQVIDTIPTLAWCNLPDGSNEFLNKRWHEYTGLSSEESQGWGWQTAIHPEDRAPLTEKWQALVLIGEPGEMEARLGRSRQSPYAWNRDRADCRRRSPHPDRAMLERTRPGLAPLARTALPRFNSISVTVPPPPQRGPPRR
jgi:PAS domain-containing protein